MDQVDWAAVELAAGELRLWLFRGDAEGAAITRPDNGDPAASLAAMLIPRLAPGAAIDVIAAGWPGTAPARVPCPPPRPADAVVLDPRLTLHRLPGLMQDRPADLIGVQTTRIAGHLARHPEFDGVLCLPGGQSAWAHVSAGEIVSFRGFLTGELLSALTASTPDEESAGFAEAVQDTLSRPAGLAGELSSLRARLAMEEMTPPAAYARMAGLLIGAELAAARPWWLGQSVTVIGAGWLADRYAEALVTQGVNPARADPTRALLDGFRAARRGL
ncbi:2-dehydro-3-deoxygalactonokinase [Paracoccus benzoatiresistens]|uniref:2-dehydro-3-deoxygalactonokinase n=1 Tax=Paracoccus benzoatiresistens TaxID=2997341 RepID=A0ABT4J590_9RHOB|nr:2-dehydro-3-deoxygalactonokinase [Paracoccus sp. EF6]MCZ0962290.1 2-dehydro-3-deoxygalactonokinase [Paracoccus sp. EF6]